MDYEWDEEKNRANKADHGVTFDVMERFEWDTTVVEIDDREDIGELREIALGFIGDKLHYLVFVALDEDTIRVISLRRATRNEKRRYADERNRQMG